MSDATGLPQGWMATSLSEVLLRLDSGRLLDHGWSPQCHSQSSEAPDEWGVLKTTSVQDGRFEPHHNKALPDTLAPKVGLEVRAGDLLLTCAGPRSRCGVACLVRETRSKLILSGKMYRFRADPSLLVSEYLEAFLRSPDAQSAIDVMKTGISDSGLNLTHDKFLDLPVPLAPLHEQHRIVVAVDRSLADLDAGVAALNRAKANLLRYKASVLQAAVTGRLTEEWRTKNPPTEDGKALLQRILRERRQKWEQDQLATFKAKGKQPPKDWREKHEEPCSRDGLCDLPDSWAWASAQQVCERVESGSTPPAPQMKSGSGDVPFIKVYNLTMRGIDFSINPTFVSTATHETLLARSKVVPNDVLMNIVGPPLCKVAIVPPAFSEWNINQAIVLFRASRVLLPAFLVICLQSDVVLRWILRTARATAGQSNISLGNSRLLPLPLPPICEQAEIVRQVAERLLPSQAIGKSLEIHDDDSQTLRQSILKAAFEGRLVPQDPSDEPASELLARIKARQSAPSTPPKRTKAAKPRKVATK